MENGHETFPTVQVGRSISILIHCLNLKIPHLYLNLLFLGVSCSKPELPDQASILHGSSYLYSDKLVISCGNGKIVETVCKADGQWSQNSTIICST